MEIFSGNMNLKHSGKQFNLVSPFWPMSTVKPGVHVATKKRVPVRSTAFVELLVGLTAVDSQVGCQKSHCRFNPTKVCGCECFSLHFLLEHR